MCTGCIHEPELFCRLQRSTEFCWTWNLICEQSDDMSWPLICHWPFPRSNRKLRDARGVAVVLGSE